MAQNRPIYDACYTTRESNQNSGILGYIIDPTKYTNNSKCRHELGIVGGPSVPHTRESAIDVESELRGITRNLSKCRYDNVKPLDTQYMILNDKTPPINSHTTELPSCQMIHYHPRL